MAAPRRHLMPTYKRPPAPNWSRGMRAAWAALYGFDAPLSADEAAQIEREHAAVPYRGERQRDLPLVLPKDERE